MKKITTITYLLICFCLISSISFAQNFQLKGRSSIGINIGLFTGAKSTNSVIINGFKTEASTNGFSGNLYFLHWFQENMSLKFSAGLLSGSTDVSVNALNTVQQASAVFPILIGLNYYLLDASILDAMRPYISGSLGMYVGSEAKNNLISQQVHSEAAMGGRAGIGIDFLVSNHFTLGANLGYNLMANFSEPIGGRENFNGGDFSFQLSYIF